MMSIEEIQAVYYMVAATGVLVAAVFYIVNLRETTKNRQMSLSNTYIQTFWTEEYGIRYQEVMNTRWSNFDDFVKKYSSNVDNRMNAKIFSLLNVIDDLGRQVRSGVNSLSGWSSVGGFSVLSIWLKFKPVIEGYRGLWLPKDAYSDLEYLAGVWQERLIDSDPDFMEKMNTLLSTSAKTRARDQSDINQ